MKNIESNDIEKETKKVTEESEKNIVDIWHPLKFKINDKYQYVPQNIIFKIFSNIIYYIIAYPILSIILKIIYDFKIDGRENIKDLKTGAFSVSNHVLVLDCAMVGIALGTKNVHFTTQSESFQIPFVRKLIKLLKAIPIPKEIKNKERMFKELDSLLQKDGIVHFYPEAILYPYCNEIRRFKNGAFNLAIKNNVPIIPIVIKFREPKGIRRVFKRKKDVTLKILSPVASNIDELNQLEENRKSKVEELKNQVYEIMKKECEN